MLLPTGSNDDATPPQVLPGDPMPCGLPAEMPRPGASFRRDNRQKLPTFWPNSNIHKLCLGDRLRMNSLLEPQLSGTDRDCDECPRQLRSEQPLCCTEQSSSNDDHGGSAIASLDVLRQADSTPQPQLQRFQVSTLAVTRSCALDSSAIIFAVGCCSFSFLAMASVA